MDGFATSMIRRWPAQDNPERGLLFMTRPQLTISLKPGQEYRFRYLLDNNRWENDGTADAYLPNPFGTEDCVVRV